MSTLRENKFSLTDYGETMQSIRRIISRSPYSMEQIAELAGIINRHGDTSHYKLYKFWEGDSYPKPGELKHLIEFFYRNKMTDCVKLLFNYFFGKIGTLILFEEYKSDGNLDDDIHYLMIQLGRVTELITDSMRDGKLDRAESIRIRLALDQLANQVSNAIIEVNNMVEKSK